jgi:hypothetical protein
MIEFFSGAVTMGFVIISAFFLRFWSKTSDRFFLAFAIAFFLFALNQFLAAWLGASDERVGFTYLLRVLGYVLILFAILDKNIPGKARNDKPESR